MKKFCENCNSEVEAAIVVKKESYTIYGEEIEVDARVLVCPRCQEEFYCEELDNETLLKAYNEYRRRHELLLPEEIKAIREQYGLSQTCFARLLHWSDRVVYRYENGSVQNRAHNNSLLFFRIPQNMRMYLEENEVSLEPGQLTILSETVENLIQHMKCPTGNAFFRQYFTQTATEENGFKVFDYEKFCGMVVYLSKLGSGLVKTKLLKLLHYADMVHYQENGISISGSRYIHFQYGPVPENIDLLLGRMSAEKVAHVEILCEGAKDSSQVIPDCDIARGVLSPRECSVLQRVYGRFASFSSSEISDYANREKGCLSTQPGEIISYAYAKEIHLIP